MKWSDIIKGVLVADSPVPEIPKTAAVENPALYQAGKQLFVQAGCRVLRACSAEGVKLCRQIVSPIDQVWAVIGTSAGILAINEISESGLLERVRQQVQRLAEAEPDAVLIQSLSDAEEALISLQAAGQACGLRIGVSMTFGSGADRTETIAGQTCEEVTTRLVEAGADMVGCNCGVSIDEMVLPVRLMRAHTDLPIIACPDAAQRELEGERIVHRETPEDFASKALSLAGAGANVIGGCCGVSAEHLRCTVEALRGERA